MTFSGLCEARPLVLVSPGGSAAVAARLSAVAPLLAGKNFKPAQGPSWNWNGSSSAPTLTPSVNHEGHWHGWLTAGVWVSC